MHAEMAYTKTRATGALQERNAQLLVLLLVCALPPSLPLTFRARGRSNTATDSKCVSFYSLSGLVVGAPRQLVCLARAHIAVVAARHDADLGEVGPAWHGGNTDKDGN